MRQSYFITLLLLFTFMACFKTTNSHATCVKGDCLNGFGVENLQNGNEYAGEYKNGKWHGKGTLTTPMGQQYVGEFKDGKIYGQGTYTWPTGHKYVGEYKDGEKNGQGTFTWPGGKKYVGEWRNNKMDGQGAFTWPDGATYLGGYKNDKRNGQGTFTKPNGEKYVGEFKDGKRNGQGTLNFPDRFKYVGEFKSDKMDGQGTYTIPDGIKYVGEFQNGKMVGQGTFTTPDGTKYAAQALTDIEKSWLLYNISQEPLKTVEGNVNKLIAVLGDGKWPRLEDKKIAIQTITESLFDFSKCSQMALGLRLRKFTTNQRQSFDALYRELLENKFISTLKRYGAKKVAPEKGLANSPQKVVIKTQLHKENSRLTRDIDYYLFYKDGKWKAYNIAIDNRDVGKSFRMNFNAILGKHSPEVLLEKMQAAVNKQNDSAQ